MHRCSLQHVRWACKGGLYIALLEHLKKHVEGRNDVRNLALVEERLKLCDGGGDVGDGGTMEQLRIGDDLLLHQTEQDILYSRKLATGSPKEGEAVVMGFAEQVRGNDSGRVNPFLDVVDFQRISANDVSDHTGNEGHQKACMALFN